MKAMVGMKGMAIAMAIGGVSLGACGGAAGNGKGTKEDLGKAVVEALTKKDPAGLLGLYASIDLLMTACPEQAAARPKLEERRAKHEEKVKGVFTECVGKADWSKAKILEVKGDRLREAISQGKVCIVAGFQGVSTDREITTLGRGGTDTTAVALAAALGADSCEIYTDVTGVFSADPRIVPQARKLAKVNFDEMLEMAGAGSKVLALRSVEFARNHNVPIHCRSSFTWEQGTWVTSEEPSVEDPIISGVVTDVSEAKVTVLGVPDHPGVSAALFEPLAAANINVDMIVQNTSTEGLTDISFTVPLADMRVAEGIVEQVAAEIGAKGVSHDPDIAKISLVGAGMKTTPGIAAKMFRTLADQGVNIEMISTSTIRISVVIATGNLELAARTLHTAFDLDSGTTYSSPLPERR